MTVEKYELLVTLDHYAYDRDLVVVAPGRFVRSIHDVLAGSREQRSASSSRSGRIQIIGAWGSGGR